ncbi:hypothetical protein Kfla_7031 [Kribbella flavida DSM 17836]|uniref:Uncharacterized protein n=1 Tax=Kribbella flavida (strain DSM 17836 / JCM 10339 / NBRC 14399) TaxID=479435 RepID=D2Q3Z7_KRIFD|nr:DUF6348 family protein [Kribbella flavida]ADB36019.1 hypothetical protein Kfla_7031 [Kribbella flavida DSM 17836]
MSDDVRLPDSVVLEMLAGKLSAASNRDWHVEDGLVRGPGTVGVTLGRDHTGQSGHLDLNFVLNLDRPETTTLSDCVAGYGDTVEDATARAIDLWLGTTGSAVFELLIQDGSFAGHFGADDPAGFPGWHLIHGGIVGWGSGEQHQAAQLWARDHLIAPILAPVLRKDLELTGGQLIGIKVFFGGSSTSETAEVRVNGEVHDVASAVLAGLDWPRPDEDLTYARTYLLLVQTA